MAEGKSRFAWSQTSTILAMLYNVNRGKNQSALHPADFNPHPPRQVAGDAATSDDDDDKATREAFKAAMAGRTVVRPRVVREDGTISAERPEPVTIPRRMPGMPSPCLFPSPSQLPDPLATGQPPIPCGPLSIHP